MLRPNISLLILTLALRVSVADAQGATTHVQLILDASGSMLGKLPDGQTRIASAKSTLTQFLGGLKADPSLNVGMRIYGAGLKAGKQCEDSVLVTPMKGFDKSALQTQVNEATPKGATPIVYSLMQAAGDFPKDSSRKVIVLVTDGEESCGGKLNDAVALFKKMGIEVDLRIIGIDLNDKARKSFDGFGTFENTRNSAELAAALSRATASTQAGTYVVSAAKTAQAGDTIDVKWTGPNNPKDFITVVKKGEGEGKYAKYEYTEKGNPTRLLMPQEPGEYEIRYSNFNVSPYATLASTPITLKAAAYMLSAATTAAAGDTIDVKWTGPNNPKDFIMVVKKGTPEGKYSGKYQYTKSGNPTKLLMPLEPGDYEIRYSSFDSSPYPTLARTAITLKAATYKLSAPASARAGSTIQVKWTGPDFPKDFIMVVKKGTAEGQYARPYESTSKGNPLSIKLPDEPGTYELRYSSFDAAPYPTLARATIEVK
ncbi:vWA domain-containing protein [Deinococcus arenicola]|uniref:VWA domain-containing protein n=1 Tax=Deinococcus arenicola TaxID=2994950 RepID=A0ABU4DT54_9DEIO|nr:VWA domain-containing protein [Deinococcus sp. ZS9-10]MDV6375624.1 VWA domain-containing protein [Deinococcus sp. ZS9-10]